MRSDETIRQMAGETEGTQWAIEARDRAVAEAAAAIAARDVLRRECGEHKVDAERYQQERDDARRLAEARHQALVELQEYFEACRDHSPSVVTAKHAEEMVTASMGDVARKLARPT